ncbi:MAG: flavin reductase family protein [Eubacteriales bacterium]|nr:flavin reductase family protein [Eubacteriales bacterium]
MDKNALRRMSYGVYIVTAKDGEKESGCTANAAMQITSEPMTIAVSINRENYTNELIRAGGQFAISILAEDGDPKQIGKFGFMSGRNKDKFAGIETLTVDGLKVMKDSCGYLTCKVIDTMETSTHTVFLGEVMTYHTEGVLREKPLTYAYYHEVLKGKSPKTAPTYLAD